MVEPKKQPLPLDYETKAPENMLRHTLWGITGLLVFGYALASLIREFLPWLGWR